MVDKRRIGLLVCGTFLCSFLSCSKYGGELDEALSLSGENRGELEMVLDYYQDNELKLKAAKFLITNMPGLSVVDTASLVAYSAFYQACDSVRSLYKATQRARWVLLIDSLWKVYRADKAIVKEKYVPLLKTARAGQLIQCIDLAFETWEKNVFTKDCSFEDFCEYILPFCRGNSFVIDDVRVRFYQLYGKRFYKNERLSVLNETDSILSLYKDIAYDTFYGLDIPILSAEALMKIGGGRCKERGAFNSLLLSALGMSTTIDFVPMWGNKGDSHSWNVVMVKGKHYAFDPFWNENNWIYNSLYSNTGVYDPSGYGELRAAKIYRKTYATHWESTLLGKGIPMENIPPLFCNFKMRDVSADYFETADVEVKLTEAAPQNAEYAYLSVFTPDEWVVQYGEIVDGKAIFKGMGKNIIYMSTYYENGRTRIAGVPFLLTSEGKVYQFASVGETDATLVISGVEPDYHWNKDYLNCMTGTNVVGYASDGTMDTLCIVSTTLPIQHTSYKLDSRSSFRFLRLNLPSDSIALGNLVFYSSEGRIPNVKITSTVNPVTENDSLNFLFDKFAYTCYRGKVKNQFIDIDLGKEYVLTSIDFSPYLRPILYANSSYELLYWENGWKSLGKQNGGREYLTFKNVPRNALFRLKQSTDVDRKVKERIFLYKDGEVIWM